MSGKLSAGAQMRRAAVLEFLAKVQRVHGLVEQYATARGSVDHLVQPIRRSFQQLKLQFMGAGYDALAQLCGSMETTISRGGSQTTKSRILREAIGSLRFQLELEQRTIVSEDLAAQQKKAEEEIA